MALQELWKNKLRTFLSLFGVTIGVFCIISVLATVNSLETNIQSTIQKLGSNTIYVSKWEWGAGGGSDFPYWKYAKRPHANISEMAQVKSRATSAQYAAFFISANITAEYAGNVLSNVNGYGITEEYLQIQPLDVAHGRQLTGIEFTNARASAIIGNEIAENLFGNPRFAVGKQITVNGKKIIVTGVIKKQGSQLIGGWQFDKTVIMPYSFARTLIDEKRSGPLLMVKGNTGVSSKVLKDELTGVMRSIRKLKPTEENNFSLNDINDFSAALAPAFASINIGGWAIGILAFIVGIFGVANIMFVTVKERTAQIGLKKAIGAKNRVIMAEFLLESAFLCIIGGLIGLLLVYALTKVVTAVFDFPLFLSVPIMMLALCICIGAGVLAGIIPARRASKLNPVVAIRS